MAIDFELYKVFYYVAKLESFSNAAQALYISQSAVSQTIKNLEEKMGMPLFFRKTRTTKLTGEGELLFKHIEQAFNFIKAGENKLHEMHNLASGEVRLGASDTVCKYSLIPYLREFNNKYPRVKIQVINRTSLQILGMLKNGLIDMGFVTLPQYEKGLKVVEFITVEDIFVAAPKFSELENRTIKTDELLAYPLLLLQKNSTTRNNIDSFFNEKKINLTPEIELESIDLLVEFAKIGLGIAHVLKESAKEAINKHELFEVKLEEKLPARRLGIVTLENVPMSRAAKEFLASLN